MAMNYDKIKEQIEAKAPDLDVEYKVKELRSKLVNLSKEGALLILANKMGIDIKVDNPKATIKTIDSLRDGDDFVEIAGATVSIYDIKNYEVCPSCAKRIHEQTSIWKCEAHGVVEPAFSYLLNIMIDDGTGVIRVTLFSRQLEKILGMTPQQILKLRNLKDSWDELKQSMLGKLFSFRGMCKSNQVTMRKEFNVKLVFKEPADVQPRVEAIAMLVKQHDKIPSTENEDDEEEESETQEELV
jgi:hypothetical protein